MTEMSSTVCQCCATQKAHGNHFGVDSCRACAAFFRRTVHSRWSREGCQRGKCNRKTVLCKPCRLQRCFEVGMETSNFQYNRDAITCLDSTITSIPDSIDRFIGKPLFVMMNTMDDTKTVVDLHRLFGEAKKILLAGAESPFFCDNQLKRLSLGMRNVQFNVNALKLMERATEKEISENWEFYFLSVAKWLTHFDEFNKLDTQMQLQLLQSVWHIWGRLEKLASTAKYRRAQKDAKRSEIVTQGNVIIDLNAFKFNSTWFSNYPGEQLRGFVIQTTSAGFDVADAIAEMNPTEIEFTYMLAQLCFQYAGNRFGGDVQKVTDAFQEVLANDLHTYYVHDLNMPRYLQRLAKMMSVNNLINANHRESRVWMEIARTFKIMKIEFTHPEMFEDTMFHATAQTAIVKAHNDLRSAIAQGNYVADGTQEPPASNMKKMKWDTSVAASAQKYANLCPDDHSGYAGLGENLYWSWTTATISNLDSYGVAAANSWQQEFQDYGWESTTLDEDTFNTGIGHATQMAWANTGAVGCGVKNCGKDASMNNMNKVTVVCQYKDQGNVLDEDIYQPGDTCTFCPSGTKCESASGLCA
ncbi:unnamed protein product [Caenorhabditis sp. 36 PRJEB53466]|nr:unnamed protein product [Caenorhabditis sp. 36 PRJEB53466]